MTRKVPTDEEVKPKPQRKAKATKTEPKPKVSHPEFNIVIEDKGEDLDTSLTICSNNGSDKKKTLNNARSKRMKRPILLEIDCEVRQYNIKNFALTVDEAKDVIKELQRMVDYLEEV